MNSICLGSFLLCQLWCNEAKPFCICHSIDQKKKKKKLSWIFYWESEVRLLMRNLFGSLPFPFRDRASLSFTFAWPWKKHSVVQGSTYSMPQSINKVILCGRVDELSSPFKSLSETSSDSSVLQPTIFTVTLPSEDLSLMGTLGK
ncbi:hypothetical protein HMI55_005222 [Coelomomyces lativittatus]|nr:hypothetical protein HMI55_005222 [Coelomomyces lativittatus]